MANSLAALRQAEVDAREAREAAEAEISEARAQLLTAAEGVADAIRTDSDVRGAITGLEQALAATESVRAKYGA